MPPRYSREDVGLGVPDLAAPFLAWARIWILTYNPLAKGPFGICASNPITGRKEWRCKGKLQLQSALWAQLSELFPSTKVRLDEMSD